MNHFGFNVNFKNTPDEIRQLGEIYLKTGLYHAIEVTYYEDMQNVDTYAYNHAIREIAAKYHPQVTVHISAFNLSEENTVLRSAILHEVENCCKYTKELGGHEIIVHTGKKAGSLHVPILGENGGAPTAEQKFARVWNLSVDMMRKICRIAAEYGVTVYTENLNTDHVTVRMSSLVDFVNEVNCPNLFIVFDIGHCHFTKGNIPEEVLLAGDKLHHLHLHDNCGEEDEHLPLGNGTIDYGRFCRALEQVDYKGLYMMELNHCDVDNLRISRERLLQCITSK